MIITVKTKLNKIVPAIAFLVFSIFLEPTHLAITTEKPLPTPVAKPTSNSNKEAVAPIAAKALSPR